MNTSNTSTPSLEKKISILADFSRHLPSPKKRERYTRILLSCGVGVHLAYCIDEYDDYFSEVTDRMVSDIEMSFAELLSEYSDGEDYGFESWEQLSAYHNYGVYQP
jgi:hypothetical protein